jgi:type IV pilus assembly protein PilM
LARSSIGLDIGTRSIRVAEVRFGGGSASLARYGLVPLQQGAVERGEIHDPQAVAAAIGDLWKQLRLSGRSVHVGLANRRVVVRIIELPVLPEEDLAAAIPFQAQEHIPIPLDQAVVDYQLLEEIEGPEGQRLMRVLVVAAELATIEPVLAAMHAAKLEVRTLELNAYPLVRSLANGSTGAEAIVDIGAGVTSVVVHHGGTIRFTRILSSFGGDEFTNAIAQGLNVSQDEAETLKANASSILRQRSGATGKRRRRAPAADVVASADLVTPLIDRFVGEIRGSIDFYRSRPDAAGLERLILTGGGSLLGGLAEQLEASIGVPVEHGHPLAHVPVRDAKSESNEMTDAEPFLGVALGLALAGSEN